MTCPRCGLIAPHETYKFCVRCGHRFGDPAPQPAAPSPPRVPAGPVRPAPATPATALTYGVTDAPIQIDQHDIAAGQPTATTADGGQLWVIRHVAAGDQTLHVTRSNAAGELSGGTIQEYFHGQVEVLFDTPHEHGRLLAHVTLSPDDTTRVLHITMMTLCRWSHGRALNRVTDDYLRYMDDATTVRTMTWTRNDVPLAPGDANSDAQASGPSGPPTAHQVRLYELCVQAVHDFLMAVPDAPWRGYGLSHDPVRYEAFSDTRPRR